MIQYPTYLWYKNMWTIKKYLENLLKSLYWGSLKILYASSNTHVLDIKMSHAIPNIFVLEVVISMDVLKETLFHLKNLNAFLCALLIYSPSLFATWVSLSMNFFSLFQKTVILKISLKNNINKKRFIYT